MYLKVLSGVFLNDANSMSALYDIVTSAMPRHYGSYYREEGLVPLNLQGSNYHFFCCLELDPCDIQSSFREVTPNHFSLFIMLRWLINDKKVELKVDYKLYRYLLDLNDGKLAINYENERNVIFSKFLRQLSQLCDCSRRLVIVGPDSLKISFKEQFGKLSLQ